MKIQVNIPLFLKDIIHSYIFWYGPGISEKASNEKAFPVNENRKPLAFKGRGLYVISMKTPSNGKYHGQSAKIITSGSNNSGWFFRYAFTP